MVRAFTVILSPDPVVGGFTAVCPAMPGAISEGETRDAALTSLAGVMAAWIDASAETGRHPLDEDRQLITAAIASVLDDREAEGWDRSIETTSLSPEQPVPA
jgi:predicted RNase H-like HicB family nuclease